MYLTEEKVESVSCYQCAELSPHLLASSWPKWINGTFRDHDSILFSNVLKIGPGDEHLCYWKWVLTVGLVKVSGLCSGASLLAQLTQQAAYPDRTSADWCLTREIASLLPLSQACEALREVIRAGN